MRILETFKLCDKYVDGMITVDNDEICSTPVSLHRLVGRVDGVDGVHGSQHTQARRSSRASRTRDVS